MLYLDPAEKERDTEGEDRNIAICCDNFYCAGCKTEINMKMRLCTVVGWGEEALKH